VAQLDEGLFLFCLCFSAIFFAFMIQQQMCGITKLCTTFFEQKGKKRKREREDKNPQISALGEILTGLDRQRKDLQ